MLSEATEIPAVPEPTLPPWLARRLPTAVRHHRHWPRLERWVVKLGTFMAAQGLLQAIMAVSGFFLLRWMEVEEYALYTLAFSIQGAMVNFSDVGFTSAIVPMVGQRVNDPQVVGAYVAAARWLRRVLLPVGLIGGGLALMVLGRRLQIAVVPGIALYALAAAGVWFNATMAVHSAPLLMRQDLGYLHAVQNAGAGTRFGGLALGHFAHWIGSVYVFAINTAVSVAQALFVHRRSEGLVRTPPMNSPEVRAARREILRFVRPQVPILLYHSVQGQIMVFIISITGTATALADIGAVSRLNQLFAFAPYLSSWIVQPYFARLDPMKASRRFFQVLGLVGGALAMVPLAAAILPQPFLWLLGHHYDHMRWEAPLMLLCATIGTTNAVLVAMCFARRWIRDDAVLWSAGLITTGQVIGVMINDVSRPLGTLLVILYGSVGGFIAYFALAMRGRHRELKDHGFR